MTKLVDMNQLANFKAKQDAANAEKFMQISSYVDNSGLIRADKVQSERGIEVVPMHVDVSDPENVKYFLDDDGNPSTDEVIGESGKIYIDISSGSKIIYTYSAENEAFIPFVSEIASTEDIEKIFLE